MRSRGCVSESRAFRIEAPPLDTWIRERLAQEVEVFAGREAEVRRARVQERVAMLALVFDEGPAVGVHRFAVRAKGLRF